MQMWSDFIVSKRKKKIKFTAEKKMKGKFGMLHKAQICSLGDCRTIKCLPLRKVIDKKKKKRLLFTADKRNSLIFFNFKILLT